MVTRITNSSQNTEINTKKQKKSIPWYITYPTATAVGGIFSYTSASIAKKFMYKDAKNLAQYITPNVVDKTMNLSEIQKLGVSVENTEWTNLNELVRKIKTQGKNYNKMSLSKKIQYKFKKIGVNAIRKAGLEIPMGKNASYIHFFKTVKLNKQRGGAYIFHELGHAKNFSSTNSVMKTLVKMRNPILSSLIMTAGLVCAFIPRAEGEDAKTTWGKTKNFLKDSSVGITAIGALATPLEEGIASIRGASIAKKILPKDQLKTVNKMNTKGFLSYLAVAAGTILTTYIIKKLTDTNKNEQTLNSTENNKLEKEAELSLKA